MGTRARLFTLARCGSETLALIRTRLCKPERKKGRYCRLGCAALSNARAYAIEVSILFKVVRLNSETAKIGDTKMKSLFLTAAAFFILCVPNYAQVKVTENTIKLAEGQTGAMASLADMAWLAGAWTGEGLAGVSEEMWSKPAGGAMVGTYRLIKDGRPVFYEICWIVEQEGTLVLRLKHFNADLTGWEEKDKTVDFSFIKKEGERVYFSGLTFEKAGKSRLNIYLALRQKDGSVKESVFTMRREF